MRLGLNVIAIVAIALGVVAGGIAAAVLRPVLAVALGGAVTCGLDLGYRIFSGNFEERGAFLELRHAMGSPTKIPLWIIAFGLAAGLGVMSFLHTPGEPSTPSSSSTSYAPYTGSTSVPAAAPLPASAGTTEPMPALDKARATKFVHFYREWLRVASDDKRDCAAVLKQMRLNASYDGESVRSVYKSGKSLPPDQQSEFETLTSQLKAALERCPDIQIQDEIARVAAGDTSD